MSRQYKVVAVLPEGWTDSTYDDISQFIEAACNWYGLDITDSEETDTTRTFIVRDPQRQFRDMKGSIQMVADRFDVNCTITVY